MPGLLPLCTGRVWGFPSFYRGKCPETSNPGRREPPPSSKASERRDVKNNGKKNFLSLALDFSKDLSLSIEKKLSQIPYWEESCPIALGSWGRGELCPGSDLDLIFCGKNQVVLKFVRAAESLGLKIRYRKPIDMEDWTKNVEVMEVNALFSAKPLTSEAFEKLEVQKNKILRRKKSFRSQLLRAMNLERKSRFRRYNSIANFLEPNIKFGAGGLRDLHQALILFYWFPERFERESQIRRILWEHKALFLFIRQRLHLTNGLDILTAGDAYEISALLGCQSIDDFTSLVQKALFQVNFYSDWISERCSLKPGEWAKFKIKKLNSWTGAFKLLLNNPSLENQVLIRKTLEGLENKTRNLGKISKKKQGEFLKKILDIRQKESVTRAVFRSGMISHLVPDFKKIEGFVQHNQYHRFTVSAHLLETVCRTQTLYSDPKKINSLGFLFDKLKLSDWNILRFTALYHDLAKGQKGEHHKRGELVARRDLSGFGFPKNFVEEVCWLVKNHLILSHGAFRQNSHSVETWKELFSKGVFGVRLYRLALFTAIDIQATNPLAWTLWKEKLLKQLVENLINPDRHKYFSFISKVEAKKIKIPESFLYELEPLVTAGLPQSILIGDLKSLTAQGKKIKSAKPTLKKSEVLSAKILSSHSQSTGSVDEDDFRSSTVKGEGSGHPLSVESSQSRGRQNPLVIQTRSKQIWIRFYSNKDEKGLLYSFIKNLTGLGCNIRQAFIHTHDQIGVYDWFQVKTRRSLNVLGKQLSHNTLSPDFIGTTHSCGRPSVLQLSENTLPSDFVPVSFSKIELITTHDNEWVFGFRAKDQKGLLLTALTALYKNGLRIVWARVHTWGNQIDDVFGVLPKKKPNSGTNFGKTQKRVNRVDLFLCGSMKKIGQV